MTPYPAIHQESLIKAFSRFPWRRNERMEEILPTIMEEYVRIVNIELRI